MSKFLPLTDKLCIEELDFAFINSSTYPICPSKKDSTYGMLRDEPRAARPKTWSARTFFYLLRFMHMNAAWQSLYVCATKHPARMGFCRGSKTGICPLPPWKLSVTTKMSQKSWSQQINSD